MFAGSVLSGTNGGLISSSSGTGTAISPGTGGMLAHSGIGLLVPSIQQFPIPHFQYPTFTMDLSPPLQHYQHMLYSLLPMQPSVYSMQQPRISMQCCAPCPDGNGICCCTPGFSTTVPPTPTSYTPYHPPFSAAANKSNQATALFASLIMLLAFINFY
ncbi:unnamed protein product [Thelazia callipaeda]|uniref:Uncharacterized protein n=1 Tax=Thelazia callipaeda TaxID=103827 RepID=A0A158RAN6_THECL|nr:unnamed protein product [Thelazia callipaeda]